MEYNIITFGNGEILKGIFDAIAICLNAHSGTLYIPLIRLSMIIGALWAALYAIYGDYIKAITGWIIPMTAIMQLLFVPQATVWITDPVTRYHQKVDHVPYGLAMIAGHISKIGYAITEQVERVFVLPDDLKYQQSGALFASHLLQQAKTFRITNEDVAENMRQFVGQCVAYDALLGRKYTIEELRHSDDIWELVSSNASPVRSFLWRDLRADGRDRERPQIITCREGVVRFNRLWNSEIDNTALLFGRKIFGKNAYVNARAELLKYLPLAYETLSDMAKSAQEILKQNMMIYAVVEGIEHKSTSLGNAPNFAVRRAYLQQRSTYETLGAMAAETLPSMKAVLEAIAYAAFLFVIPLAVLPFGWKFLSSWIQTLLWLQMWAPLYAVLNYIMTMAARAKSISALSLSNEAGITIANSVGLVNVNADIAAMAGYLAMSIPFLSIALVKGVGSFVHLASHLSNVTQGSASQAATEATTGNYSFGNISEGNRQISNTNMLNHSYAASYRSGSFQQADGRSDLITSADGQQILNVSSSNLPITLNVAETQSSQLSKQASQSYQTAISKSAAYAKSMAETLRQSVDLSDHIGNSKQSSDHYNDGKSIEQSKSLSKSAQIIKDFAINNNLTATQSAEFLAAGSIGGTIGLSTLRKMGKGKSGDSKIPGEQKPTDVSLGADIKGNVLGSAQIQDIYQKAEKVAKSEEFQSALRQTVQSVHNQSFAKNDEEGKKLAEGIANSWDESNNFREEANKSFRQTEDLQRQASLVKSSAASINANYTQEFVDWLSQQKADNTNGHIGKQGAAYIIASQPEIRLKYAQRFLAEKNLLPSEPSELQRQTPDHLQASYENENSHAFINVDKDSAIKNMSTLKAQAKSEGLTEVNDNGIIDSFNNREQEAGQKLKTGEEQMNQAYNAKESLHKVRAKKNLTVQAAKQGLKHGRDAAMIVLDPVMDFAEYYNEQINAKRNNAIKGEKQSE